MTEAQKPFVAEQPREFLLLPSWAVTPWILRKIAHHVLEMAKASGALEAVDIVQVSERINKMGRYIEGAEFSLAEPADDAPALRVPVLTASAAPPVDVDFMISVASAINVCGDTIGASCDYEWNREGTVLSLHRNDGTVYRLLVERVS